MYSSDSDFLNMGVTGIHIENDVPDNYDPELASIMHVTEKFCNELPQHDVNWSQFTRLFDFGLFF